MPLTDTHYVKFTRGTPAAFNKLTTKSSDTLYFISEPNADSGILYLGTKKIGDGVGVTGATKISELQDVILDAIGDKQILVYDLASQKWKNASISTIISVMKGATTEAAGEAGLVPVAQPAEKDFFLRGDGVWAKAGTVAQVFQAEATAEQDDMAAITAAVGAAVLNPGDQAIVKRVLTGARTSYTAYVYDGSKWAAMDGNYSADNVYFTSDLTLAGNYTEIGNITKGQTETKNWAVTGMSVKDIMTAITTKKLQPTATNPSVGVTLTQAKAYEVGTTVTPSYTTSFNKGAYTFGPDTGITVSSWTVKDTKNVTKTTATGTFDALQVTDGINYTVTATAAYTEGAIAKDNIGGDSSPVIKIPAGAASKTSAAITGYRNSFYGTLESKGELTSDIIRGLTKSGRALADGNTISVAVPVGAQRVIFAYPKTLGDVNKVLDVNGLNANITSAFTKIEVNVEGADGYTAIAYNVYYTDYANPNDKANTYTVTI